MEKRASITAHADLLNHNKNRNPNTVKEVLTFALIWIFAALVTVTLWHAAVGGNDDDNYPPKL